MLLDEDPRSDLRPPVNLLGMFITVGPSFSRFFASRFRRYLIPLIVLRYQGNGIQATFEEDPNVLYISIHRYENASFYPNDTSGSYSSKGRGRGLGL